MTYMARLMKRVQFQVIQTIMDVWISLLSTFVKEKENKDNTLLIHAGDMVGGNPPVSLYYKYEGQLLK